MALITADDYMRFCKALKVNHLKLIADIEGLLQREDVPPFIPDWMTLPADLFMLVFSFLTPQDRTKLRLVNHTFRMIIDHPSNWVKKTVKLVNVHKYEDASWELMKQRNVRIVELTKLSKKNFKKVSRHMSYLKGMHLTMQMKLANLQTLRQHLDLEQLGLKDCSLLHGNELLSNVTAFKRLTSLELGNISVMMDENLSHLAKLKELHTLALCKANTATTGSGFQITGEGLQYVLFRLPKLKSLTLHAINGLKFNLSTALTPPKDDNGLISLKENRRKKSKMQIDHPLKQLRLQTLKLPFSLNFPLSEVALEQLQSVTYLSLQESYLLRRRDLNSTDVTRIFKRLHNVRKLDLSCSNCQNVVLSNLPPGVEWLELRDCYSVSVLGIHSLSRSVGSNLKYLGLSFCNRLSASLVSAFDKLFPKLEGLDLSCCRSVGDVHVKTFNNMKRLTYLRLVGCTKLSEESVKIARIESANRLFIIGPKYVNNYKK